MLDYTAETLLALSAHALPPRYSSHIADVVISRGSFAALMEEESVRPALTSGMTKAEVTLHECERLSIAVLPLSAPHYPVLLRESAGPPLVLFVRSTTRDFKFSPTALSIVGSRAASVETCALAATFARAFSMAGITVVSGLALGVDGAAHRGALEGTAVPPTIAVLAHGLDTMYPSSHARLAERIIEAGGSLVSEYVPGVQPLKHHFLERNRIVAALSRGVVVVQAGSRSGSLVTARYAADAGRDVFVVAARDDGDGRFEGGSKLIVDGARSVSEPGEVLKEYGVAHDLAVGLVTIPVEELLAAGVVTTAGLMRLELSGRVDRQPGGAVRMSRATFGELIDSARSSRLDS